MPLAKKLLPASRTAILRFTVTAEPAGAWIWPATNTLSALITALLPGVVRVILGALLMTVITFVSVAPCGLAPFTVIVLLPVCRGTFAAVNVLPLTIAAMPFTVMVAVVAPENVPVTVTLLSSMVAPFAGLAIVRVSVLKVYASE